MSGCKRKSFFAALLLLLFSGTDLFAGWVWEFPFYKDEPAGSLPSKKSAITPPAPASSPAMQTNGPSSGKSVNASGDHNPLPVQTALPPEIPGGHAAAATVSEKLLPPRPLAAVAAPPRTLVEFTPDFICHGDSIVEDSHWSGQVLLDGWVTIAPQATLSIQPGTVIRVSEGGGFLVLGRLVLKGDEKNPIVITSRYAQSRPADWRGIYFSGTDKNNTFEHVHIEGGDTAVNIRFSSFAANNLSISNSAIGIQLQDGLASLSTTSFTGKGVGIVAANSELELDSVSFTGLSTGIVATESALLAADILFTGSSVSGLSAEQSQLKIERLSAVGNETGARLKKCEGSIVNSSFRDNRESGAILTSSRLKMTGNLFTGNRTGLQLDDNFPAIWGNAIYSNRSYNLLYLGEGDLFIGGNWFGAAGFAELERTFFSKRPGAIRLDPLLTANPMIVQ